MGIRSGAAFISAVNAVMKTYEEKVIEAFDDTAEEILTTSRDRYCPEDTGRLKGSAKKEHKTSDNRHEWIISFNTPYAIYVEKIPYHHVKGQWKYLQTAFDEGTVKLASKVKGIRK